jgi:hypothetical protein
MQQPGAAPPTNVAAIISVASAVVALLLIPILLGPLAIIAGIVGVHQARREQRTGGTMAVVGIVIGIVATLLVAGRLATL